MQVLALEASTTSAKAMVYDLEQGVINLVVLPYDTRIGDSAKQNTVLVYESMLEAGRKAAQGREIMAVALGGIWHGLVVCDSKMKPLTPTYTWACMEAAELATGFRKDRKFTQRAYHATGCMAHAIYPAYKLAFLKQKGLELKDKYIAGQGSYNFFRLTGERLTSLSMASGSGLLNLHTMDYDEDALALSGIKKRQMGVLCTHTDTRPLLESAAKKLGIAAGIPVVPAMADGALNQVGSGALKSGNMTFSVGTSAAMRVTAKTPVLPDTPSTWCYYTAGKYLCGAATSGATNCVDWFVKNILAGRMRYADIERQIRDTENPPIFMPFLYGERCPGWRDELKGGFFDLTGSTGIGEQYYAVLEGVLFNLYQCYIELIKLTGEPGKILVSGGICNSRLWLSMLADLFQKEITLLSNEQASLLGGAVLALSAVNGINDIEEFTVEADKTILPDKGKSHFYQQRFSRYRELYAGLV